MWRGVWSFVALGSRHARLIIRVGRREVSKPGLCAWPITCGEYPCCSLETVRQQRIFLSDFNFVDLSALYLFTEWNSNGRGRPGDGSMVDVAASIFYCPLLRLVSFD